MSSNSLIDRFGREISYLRLSLTDRCNVRCFYCMSERPTFMPKANLLDAAEIKQLLDVLVKRGIKKVRLSGGEPLVRKDFFAIAEMVAAAPLDEWTLTTNGMLLPELAKLLAALGLRRVNVSLDSLNPKTFEKITRGGELAKALAGIAAASEAGIHVKINCVALAGINEHELSALIEWAHRAHHDITLIETMPMSDTGLDLTQHYLPLTKVKSALDARWQLIPEVKVSKTAGPAQFFRVRDTGGRIGFITPLSHKFCANCNRIRIGADGKLWTCLGQNHFVDLKQAMREEALEEALNQAMAHKPLEHNFEITKNKIAGSPQRMMASTGG